MQKAVGRNRFVVPPSGGIFSRELTLIDEDLA